MPRETRQSSSNLSRRAAIGGVGAAVAAVGLGQVDRAMAQEATPGTVAGHPLAGTWLVNTPGGLSPATFAADGSVTLGVPPSYVDPALGTTFQGPALGTWEPDGGRRGHFTVVQALSDANGTYLGTVLFEGYPEVSADGQSFGGDTPQRVIVRDAANNVTFDQVIPMEPEVTGTRIGATIESVVFPAPTSTAGTPAP
jgi:hypothetical protein